MKKILLIDDTPDILENLTEVLKFDGYELLTGTNGAEGMEKLEYYVPDLIITDLRMPVMDGFIFIAELKLKQNTKNIPILVFSANATIEDEQKTLKLGASGFIRKPCSMEKLIEVIESLI